MGLEQLFRDHNEVKVAKSPWLENGPCEIALIPRKRENPKTGTFNPKIILYYSVKEKKLLLCGLYKDELVLLVKQQFERAFPEVPINWSNILAVKPEQLIALAGEPTL